MNAIIVTNVIAHIRKIFQRTVLLILYSRNDDAVTDDDRPDEAEHAQEKIDGDAPALKPDIYLEATPNLPRTKKSWSGLFNPTGSPVPHEDDAGMFLTTFAAFLCSHSSAPK